MMKFKNLLKKRFFYTAFIYFVLFSTFLFFVPVHSFVKGVLFYFYSSILYKKLFPLKKDFAPKVKPAKTILQFKQNQRHNFLFWGSDSFYSKSFDSNSIINRPIQEITSDKLQSIDLPLINFKSFPSNFINFN